MKKGSPPRPSHREGDSTHKANRLGEGAIPPLWGG